MLIVDEPLELSHAVFDLGRRRRDKMRNAGPSSSNPVLRAAEFTRRLFASPAAGEKLLVYFPNEPVGERETLAQPRNSMFHGRDVIRNLDHIIKRDTRRLFKLKQQQV